MWNGVVVSFKILYRQVPEEMRKTTTPDVHRTEI